VPTARYYIYFFLIIKDNTMTNTIAHLTKHETALIINWLLDELWYEDITLKDAIELSDWGHIEKWSYYIKELQHRKVL
jgi:hypothetical protein|tara:strand:+ start:286 stop:519 length:234 start_codon:yes stop_codon:yes gene_type:complete